MDITIGSVIRGKYRVDRVIGKGGMGVVVAATHLGLDQVVAIKFLLPEMLTQPIVVERFAREARAASKIQSDHVARVTDVDTIEDGTPYMVMEYLEGRDLSFVRKKKQTIPVDAAVSYLLEASEAIIEAHRLGIIHRDLKPANLFLSKRADGKERVKVLDFGISKVGGGEGDVSVTQTQAIVGSAEYMSPELMLSAREADARSDVWALGVSLYEILTGRVPFLGESLTQVCALVLQVQPDPPSRTRAEVSPALDAIVMKCLEKDRNRRYQTVRELVDALTAYRAEASSARAVSPPGNPSEGADAGFQRPAAFALAQANRAATSQPGIPPDPAFTSSPSQPSFTATPVTGPALPIGFGQPPAPTFDPRLASQPYAPMHATPANARIVRGLRATTAERDGPALSAVCTASCAIGVRAGRARARFVESGPSFDRRHASHLRGLCNVVRRAEEQGSARRRRCGFCARRGRHARRRGNGQIVAHREQPQGRAHVDRDGEADGRSEVRRQDRACDAVDRIRFRWERGLVCRCSARRQWSRSIVGAIGEAISATDDDGSATPNSPLHAASHDRLSDGDAHASTFLLRRPCGHGDRLHGAPRARRQCRRCEEALRRGDEERRREGLFDRVSEARDGRQDAPGQGRRDDRACALLRQMGKEGERLARIRARVIELSPKNDSRLFEAKKRHDELGKKLPTVRIDVPQAVADLPGLEIDREGVAVEASAWNHDDPSDTGHFAFTASATGKKPWTGAIDVSETGSVTVSIPMLDDVPKAVAPPPPPPPPKRPLWPAGVGYGVTAVLVGVGIGSLVAANKAPTVECAVGGCPAGDAFQKNQNLMSNVSLGSFIGAGIAAGASTGLLIWAITGKHPTASDADHASIRFAPSLSPAFAGGLASGAF